MFGLLLGIVVDDKVVNGAKSTGCDDAREFLAGSSRGIQVRFCFVVFFE